MASKVETADALSSFVATKINAATTAAGAVDSSNNVNSSLGVSIAQTIHSGFDLGTKGLQTTSPVWGKAIPAVGTVLGVFGLAQTQWGGDFKNSDYAGVAGNGLTVAAGGALLVGAPVVAGGLAITGVVAGAYQLYSQFKERAQENAESQEAKEAATGEIGSLLSRYPAAIDANLRPTMPNDPRRLDNPNDSESAYYSGPHGGGSSNSQFGGYNGFAGNTTPGSGYGMGESGGSLAPIVIDLDGNGIDLYLNGHSTARFDVDDDGYLESTAWAGPKDGILVIDEGGDNKITQSKEIAFAKWTAAEGDTDLQGLAATFDSNRDGVLDVRDQRFGDFKVWKDANSNGAVDAGEMQTLAQAGIKSMNLVVKDGTSTNLDDGTQVSAPTRAWRHDGSIAQSEELIKSSRYLWRCTRFAKETIIN